MDIRLGIYEVFSRIIPGGIYVVAIYQLMIILGVATFDLQVINSLSFVVSIGLIVLAYILGGAFDNLALAFFRLFKHSGFRRTFSSFKERHQDHWRIEFNDEDWPILLAFIRTKNLELPDEVIADLKFFLLVGNKPAAVKRVCELTGVGLRASKDFVDSLQ